MGRFRREEVLACLAAAAGGRRPRELAEELGVPPAQHAELRRLLRQLGREGLLVRLRAGRYAVPAPVQHVVGIVRLDPRGGSRIEQEGRGPDVWVRSGGLAGANEGDLVRAEVRAGDGGHQGWEGRVVEVVQRRPCQVVGTFRRLGHRSLVEPDGAGRGGELVVEPPIGIEDGDRVVAEPGPRVGRDGRRRGRVAEVLGQPDDPGLDYALTALEFELPDRFPPAALSEVEALEVDLRAQLAVRRDLRAAPCLTIDPPEAQDFDDAVSLEAAGDGYCLGVHIADVSHYVGEGTAVDQEARRRGTSVYLLDRVVPMLPERLANDLCTLKPRQDRLAVSVLMRFGADAELLGYEIVDSVVHSVARLTYPQVQAVFEGGTDAAADPWRSMLEGMRALSRALRARRRERGAIDLDVPEPFVRLDRRGRPTDLGRYPRLESHQLIEEFMLAANQCVGRWASDRELPVLYRVHRPPDPAKLRALSEQLAFLGVARRASGRVRPRDLQALGEAAAAHTEPALIHQLVLRAMMRAEYSPADGGHFGLACRDYLHFTSPIRRYPDLWVHRAVKACQNGRLPDARRQGWEREAHWLGPWCSRCERRADEAERAYVRTKQLRYLAGHLGREWGGRVSGVVRGGVFVELDEWQVEGFCPLGRLPGRWGFDAVRRCLVGRGGGPALGLGTPVRVRLAGADPAMRRLDLQVVNSAPSRPTPHRTPRRQPSRRRTRR